MKQFMHDIQGKLPYVSCGLAIIALIVCATTRHEPLLLVAHSAIAFLGVVLCIHHYRCYADERILPHVHLPYAVMFFLSGIVIGGHGGEATAAVVMVLLAVTASATFYTREAVKEYNTPLQSTDSLEDHDVSGFEE